MNILKEHDEREGVIELMEGKWEWNTGAKMEFSQAGKTHDGHLALWVINPAERLLYHRAGGDWHYDIVLSEDGESFTAKRIQSGKEYSAKRISPTSYISEQGADDKRVGEYTQRWERWVRAGLGHEKPRTGLGDLLKMQRYA